MGTVRQLPRTKIVTIPAPVGGWNARDSLAEMGPKDAVTLQNYWPKTTSVALRNGFSKFATGMTGQIETVMAYAGSTTNKLFAASAGGLIYNITAGGAIGGADVSGMTGGRWQYINIATSGGNYLMAVNGSNKARYYIGTAWAADGDGAPYDITVVDSATCIGINVHKNRVWLIKKNTLKAYYLPTASIGGAAAVLDLSAFCPHGGYLVGMATWTIDAGTGVDDYAVFLTSKGDLLVYQGTDPASATTWALRGVWWLGSPVGYRSFVKWKGDLLIICQDGLLPLSGALQSSRLNPRVSLTDNIQQAMSQAVTDYGSNFGWQVIPYPKENALILNVPVTEGASQEQYVMNTITGAWAQFNAWPANCWELFNDRVYFGGNTYVGKGWDTYADAGSAIEGFILQAFSEFGNPGIRKRATSMRPLFLTNGSPTIYGGINWNYNLAAPSATLSTASTDFASWDSANSAYYWDAGTWGGGLNSTYEIQSVTGSGWAGAPVFKSSTIGVQIELVSNSVSVEIGGFL